ncbi:hypothetical protein CR513_44653, partial [Mucuna pruriens]
MLMEAADGVVLTYAQKKNIEDQALKDRKAKNYLLQALDDNQQGYNKKHMGFYEAGVSRYNA